MSTYPNGTPSPAITGLYQSSGDFTPEDIVGGIVDNHSPINKATMRRSIGREISQIENWVNKTYLGREADPCETGWFNRSHCQVLSFKNHLNDGADSFATTNFIPSGVFNRLYPDSIVGGVDVEVTLDADNCPLPKPSLVIVSNYAEDVNNRMIVKTWNPDAGYDSVYLNTYEYGMWIYDWDLYQSDAYFYPLRNYVNQPSGQFEDLVTSKTFITQPYETLYVNGNFNLVPSGTHLFVECMNPWSGANVTGVIQDTDNLPIGTQLIISRRYAGSSNNGDLIITNTAGYNYVNLGNDDELYSSMWIKSHPPGLDPCWRPIVSGS